ncbi:MAG: response regulator transcription factor [Gemmatimonadota bacterium]|nr:response regulator transcription factor [Gemmatimonadota bacterium]
MSRILIIEDERDLALGLRANLEIEGYEVSLAHEGEEGFRHAMRGAPDLVILDLMLPDVDGYDVLRRMRQARLEMPVLLLTARSEELDKVRGFRTGADDYVTKPFGVMELLVRIEAILRRGRPRGPATPESAYRFGDVEVDVDGRLVRRASREVALTPKAFDLLIALLQRDGKVATRLDLLRDVWGYSPSITTRTLDAHVAELRRKLEDDPANPVHLLTVWKVGYRLRR